MTARYATADEIASWDSLILKNPDGGNVFSSYEYSEIKKLTHYKPRYVITSHGAVTVLEKTTPPLGVLWYLPKGPNVTTVVDLMAVITELKPLAKKAHAFAVRIESEIESLSEPILQRHGFKKARPIIPNPSTITLDISTPLDDILASMPQKGRYAIHRAERDGVTIKMVPSTKENTKQMFELLRETAEGQFGIRSYHYYDTFWKTFADAGLGQLFFAYYDGKPVAGAYVMTFGTKSTYKDGASIRKRTAYGASHLLQWRVIEWAKSKGATLHDFCGSPPSDEITNPNHPHYGIGLFKLSFSKHVVDYIGCYDIILSKTRYAAWLKAGERLYRHFYYKKTKDYYY